MGTPKGRAWPWEQAVGVPQTRDRPGPLSGLGPSGLHRDDPGSCCLPRFNDEVKHIKVVEKDSWIHITEAKKFESLLVRDSLAPAGLAPRVEGGPRSPTAATLRVRGLLHPAPCRPGLQRGWTPAGTPHSWAGAPSWGGVSLPSVGRSQGNGFERHCGTVRVS